MPGRSKRPVAIARALELRRALRDGLEEVKWLLDELRHRTQLQPANEPPGLTETEGEVLKVVFDEIDDCTAAVLACVHRPADVRQLRLLDPSKDRASQVRVDLETESLTEAQRDGRACLRCGRSAGPMKPAGWLLGCQVFEHDNCEVSS